MPVQGIPRFNAVALLEIEAIDFSKADIRLIGHGAFISTETGDTYGSTSCTRWSKETIEKLKELRAAMEQDLANLVFESNETPTSGSNNDRLLGGIREHAGAATDAESV